jgi:tetratricopeptide (TPR) repeat protein
VYQAKVCLGWLHWTVDEYGLAAVRLPTHLDYEQLQSTHSGALSDWTSVCALKAAYLKADCLSVEGQRTEALAVFEAALPALMHIWDTRSSGKQLRYCSELFLTEFCMMHSRFLQSGQTTLHDVNSLGCFRAWAKYWDIHGGSALGGHGFRGSVPRRRVWSEYYAALSTILDRDLPLPSGFKPATPASDTSDRNQLRIELKKAEAAYEALLIAETRFPRADEHRDEVEDFVRSVLANWAVLCGRGWREQDLGPGGREGTSRAVIDLLYRAATRTYHSTSVLRSLFTVHLAVSEFDLAFKAFDSYLDLVRHGKARVDKSGHAEAGLDDDATVLETIAHCILALCRYGGRDAIEKARDLGSELEDWLARLPQLRAPAVPADPKALPEVAEEVVDPTLHPEIPPSIVALSWQAIGLSQAHWTRVTYDAGLRTEIQAKAVRCLRKALSPELGRTRDVRTLFALGLLLAEKRELTSAIEIVKTALISNKAVVEDDAQHYNGPYWQERSLIPLWHLLALLLSARQEFMTAARACDGAFEQFRDTSVLFGDSGGFKSDHLNELAGKATERKGLVDEMEDFEREGILEIKMTQLTLVELLEGPDVAVNASFELLSLFSRLFGDVQPKKPTATAASAAGVPQSSAGTLRSIKGSIFGGRSERSGRTTVGPPPLENQASAATTDRPQTTQTTASGAPTIQVTAENGNTTERKASRRLSNTQRRSRSNSGKRNSLKKRESSSSRHRPPSLGDAVHSPTVVDGEVFFTPTTEPTQPPLLSPVGKRQPGLTFSREHTLSHAASYMSQASKSTVQSFSEVSPDATYTITAPLPIIQFPQEQIRRHRVGILVRVWLMIAGFYRRADMFEDAKGAVAEAQKLVQGLDQERDASVSPTTGRGAAWAERKSLDELWGDVWAEVRNMSGFDE